MGELTLYNESDGGNTVISNCFIDYYLADANDAQIKVYLYLMRIFNAGQVTSISAIADHFNHTEKDIMRALCYWEQKGLLSLDFDDSKNLTGIQILTPRMPKKEDTSSFTPFVTLMPAIPHKEEESVDTAVLEGPDSYQKPNYSLDELKAFQENEQTSELLFIAEQYLKKTLSANDIRSILFLSDTLKFSNDLIDYLLQYCVQKEKKSFRYIESVAIDWAGQNIKTPADACAYTSKYDRNVYTIMNALGKSSSPTTTEIDFIMRWSKEWGFTTDIILEACERTVLATDKHRFEYADKILANWKKNAVHTKADINKMDSSYRKNKKPVEKTTYSNMFTQFEQHDYDFEALEKKLLSKK